MVFLFCFVFASVLASMPHIIMQSEMKNESLESTKHIARHACEIPSIKVYEYFFYIHTYRFSVSRHKMNAGRRMKTTHYWTSSMNASIINQSSSSNKLSMTFRLPSSSSSTLFQHLPISIHYNTNFGIRQRE
jgi:predicted DNA-binding protein (UPF0278 family)